MPTEAVYEQGKSNTTSAPTDTSFQVRRGTRWTNHDATISNRQSGATTSYEATEYGQRGQKSGTTRYKHNSGPNRPHLRQSRIAPTYTRDEHELLWGDDPLQVTNVGCRLISQNSNGISKNENYTKAHEIGEAARAIKADIVGLSETNLNWKERNVKAIVATTLRRYWKQIKTAFSSSDRTFDGTEYQPGGTALIVGQPWSGRATMQDDTSGLGRWTEATLTGKADRKVTIISAYRVTQNRIENCGPFTAFTQQWHLLRMKGISSPDPREQFFVDLGIRLSSLRQQQSEIILMLDANDTLQNPNSRFTRWVREQKLVDIHVRKHGTDDEPPTYARGSKRIDYILTSAEISDYVTAAGILPLHEFITSDHRALFIDVALKEYLRDDPNPMVPACCRGIQSNDPRAVRKYRHSLEKKLDRSGLENEIADAQHSLQQFGYDETIATVLNSIDHKFATIRLEAERECAIVVSHPWSPKLREAQRNVQYWKLWLSELKLGKDFSAKRRSIKDSPAAVRPTLNTASRELRMAQRELRHTIKKAKDLRREHLVDCSDRASIAGKEKVARAIKQIQRSEALKATFTRLRSIMKSTKSGALNHVLVEDGNGNMTTVHDQAEINNLLLERNAKHFSQADGTPFTCSPLTELLGRHGTNANCQKILDGTFDTSTIQTTEATKEILRQLKRISCGTISTIITAEDVRTGYKKWRESTSTSPSGLHLGHEKALLRVEEPVEPDQPVGRKTLSDRIFLLKANLLNIAIQNGHVYDRWTTVVNAMIEKTPGRPLVSKLRVIHLIESDLNLLTGILWGRRLMWHYERLHELGDDQGGSRSDRKAQDILLFKHILYSVVRLTKTDCSSFDNDAKSCYDRIVMLIASLCSQRVGMEPRACELFLRTLDKTKYHVKTQLGISEGSYSTTDAKTIHGPGQGGRSSPAIWTIISCLLMKCMRTKAKGALFTDPTSKYKVDKISSGFVDDITHFSNSFSASLQDESNLQDLTKATSITAQWWEELLHATGGKLELQKCFFYMMYWVFNQEGEARLLSKLDTPSSVQITDSETGNIVHIEQQDCDTPHKTLGAMETPSGDYKSEVKRLVDKGQSIAQRIASTSLTAEEARIIYRSMYLPSISYSFPAGILTLQEAEKVQGATIQALLAALGYNPGMPRAVVFGPIKSGGIGLRHLFAEQGTLKTMIILQQIRTNRSLGQMLQIQLRWAQRVAGTSIPILEEADIPLPQLQGEKWLGTLREFLTVSELGIHVQGIECPMMRRSGDHVLMDVACRCNLSDEEIRKINRCRLYLRAECLSDLCNAEGTLIQQSANECDPDARIVTDEAWPRQPRPGKLHRKVWKSFLSNFCLDGSSKLRQEMGDWTRSPARQQWIAIYDPEWDRAMTREADGSWTMRSITSKTRRG